jgi:uncharacterized membrane-anchored protein
MKRIILYVCLALQVAGLSGFYSWHASLPAPRYLLETRPVDPRDLLRGNYLTLGYQISVPPAEMENLDRGEGKTVFVRLKPQDGFYVIDTVADAPVEDGAPWLRAHWKNQLLDYGIDRYYMPETLGTPDGRIAVEIGIRKSGAAQITRIFRNGTPWP